MGTAWVYTIKHKNYKKQGFSPCLLVLKKVTMAQLQKPLVGSRRL